MSESPTAARAEATSNAERSSASLLVRCWLEPSGVAGEPPALRGYVKNLKTGEELFIKDLDAVGEQLRRQLEGESESAAVSWNPSQSTRSSSS